MLAVGILLGAGFPGAAAAVTVLVDRQFPDDELPWLGGGDA